MGMTSSLVISTDAATSPHLVNLTVDANPANPFVRLAMSGRMWCVAHQVPLIPCPSPCAGHQVEATLRLPRSSVLTVAEALRERIRDAVGGEVPVSASVYPEGDLSVAGSRVWSNPAMLVEHRRPDLFQIRILLEEDFGEDATQDRQITMPLPQGASAYLEGALTNWLQRRVTPARKGLARS
ncbi:hypothetical protein ACI796_03785 [Geodermatophilus sp. SYSU D00525]